VRTPLERQSRARSRLAFFCRQAPAPARIRPLDLLSG
jgi:hypothetical protein